MGKVCCRWNNCSFQNFLPMSFQDFPLPSSFQYFRKMTSLRRASATVNQFLPFRHPSEISAYWPVESCDIYHYNSFLSKRLNNIYQLIAFKIARRELAIEINDNFHIQIFRRTFRKTCRFFMSFSKLCSLLGTKPPYILKISAILGKKKNSIIRSN